jgi:hypothetical protein
MHGCCFSAAIKLMPQCNHDHAAAASGELIFSPLVSRLQSLGVTILGGRRVQEITQTHHITDPQTSSTSSTTFNSSSSRVQLPGVVIAKGPDGVLEKHQADVVVLAAGVPALQQLLRTSPVLAAAGVFLYIVYIMCNACSKLYIQQRVAVLACA